MTSRERVLSSIAHREPDKIPRDLGSTPSSGISAVAYANLLEYLKMNAIDIKIYDVVQQVVQVDDEIIRRYCIDVLDIGRTFNKAKSEWREFILQNGKKAYVPVWFDTELQSDGSLLSYKKNIPIAKMPNGATFFDQLYFPYIEGYPNTFKNLKEDMEMVSWSALVHSPWDHAKDAGFWETLRNNAIRLKEESDQALMIVCGCNLFEWGTFLRRIDNFLCDIMLDAYNVERLLDSLIQIHLNTLENVCKAVGDVCDILRFGDDLGTNHGPFMHPEIYRKLFKPHHIRLNEYVHKNSHMKTLLHSCGSIYKLMPDLIDAGYDIINPVQISSAGMEPRRLKREFGENITFWGGGCDTKTILNRGTPDKVKEHVKEMIDIFAPGGGFIFNTVHNIMPDCPPQNIEAMFEVLEEY